jgi:serine/threonine protein kinase
MADIKLGKYTLHEKLGSGGFGTVYRATDAMGRTVAVKMLKPGWSDDPETIERFRREALAAGVLFHPHIATILDIDEFEGRRFLVMRYVDGPSLDKILEKKGRLSWDEALQILKEVSEGLDYAHQRGFVHRDIKPANIMISPDEGAVITDFGLAKAAQSSGLSTSGVLLGTPSYIAPEVWEGEQVSPATDVYSLACVFDEMVSGEVLFAGDSPPQIMTQHVNKGPQFPQKWAEDVPKGIQAVLEKALAQKPADRLSSAGNFSEAIEELGRVREPAGTTVGDRWQRFREGFSKNRGWIFAGLGLIAVLVVTPLLSNAFKKSSDQPSGAQTVAALALLETQIEDRLTSIAAAVQVTITHIPLSPTPLPTNTSAPKPSATVLPARITDDYNVEMVLAPAGAFEMGSRNGDFDESPVHTVRLDDYYIDKYEVTNELYARCVQAGECQPPSSSSSYTHDSYYGNPEFDDYPVIWVDWQQAQTFCQWRGARLPSEAEWEKAARGTHGRTYPWGEGFDCTKANYGGCSGDTEQVGAFPDGASPYGALDMAGNVWEWVADWYDDNYYSISPSENPAGPASGQYRVLRGGSWSHGAVYVRTALRVRY